MAAAGGAATPPLNTGLMSPLDCGLADVVGVAASSTKAIAVLVVKLRMMFAAPVAARQAARRAAAAATHYV